MTKTSIHLDWDNCPYHTGTNKNTGWTKYIPSYKSSLWSGLGDPDDKTVLDPEDDVAHVKIGGSWRMPTVEEFEELIENCDIVWTTLTGFTGRKFTSKKNGNSIFLPATGYRNYDSINNAGAFGYYWSSSCPTDYPGNAYTLGFESDGVYETDFCRYQGLSVRPVSE